jgi:Survival motor neuron (SMN) interacting protein 1 (SIP1)
MGLKVLLRFFRREERRLPLVTRVPNPYAVPEKPRLDSQKSREVESSAGAIPSEEWRTCFEERFRNLRTVSIAQLLYLFL